MSDTGDKARPDVKQVECPVCGKAVPWDESSPFRPFCSKKCQLIDFGDWAAERHAIPAETPPGKPVSSQGEES